MKTLFDIELIRKNNDQTSDKPISSNGDKYLLRKILKEVV